MKNMNIRMNEKLHKAMFQLALEESLHQGRRVSMNNLICFILERHIEPCNEITVATVPERPVGAANCNAGQNMSKVGDINSADELVGMNACTYSDKTSDANGSGDVDGIGGVTGTEQMSDVSGVNGMSNLDGAIGATHRNDINEPIGSNRGKPMAGIPDANSMTGTDAISLTEHIRRALLNGDKICIQDIAKAFNAKAGSVSSIKSRTKKELLKKGLLHE